MGHPAAYKKLPTAYNTLSKYLLSAYSQCMQNYRAFELLGVLIGLILAKLIFFLNLGLLAHCGGGGEIGRVAKKGGKFQYVKINYVDFFI